MEINPEGEGEKIIYRDSLRIHCTHYYVAIRQTNLRYYDKRNENGGQKNKITVSTIFSSNNLPTNQNVIKVRVILINK